MTDLRKNESISAKALMFTILTAARTSETTGATWDEIDLDAEDLDHPCRSDEVGARASGAAVRRGDQTPQVDAQRRHQVRVRGSQGSRPLSNMAMLQLLRGIHGDGATVHGFRSSFRDWAADQTDAPREVVEACLAHAVGDGAELAYKRTDFLEKRRAVMAEWARHCIG